MERKNPIEIEKEEFRKVGYQLIDEISEFISTINQRPVTSGEGPKQIQELLNDSPLPDQGTPTDQLFSDTTELLFNHSLFNGHPKFFGYITSSAAPIGALGDLLAATVNPNVGAHLLSPVATEIERQTIKWLAEFIGVSTDSGGILVSGGNMANFTAFLAARTAMTEHNVKEEGLNVEQGKLTVYCSKTTHTWIDKAAILFGLGSNAVRWIKTNRSNQMDENELEKTIREDKESGFKPIMVIGTAGDVSTGAVDNIRLLSEICKKYNLWLHVDGAYGIPAAVVPEYQNMFDGIEEADSIALDPHKWLYSPLEAGCTLVKNPKHLTDTFSSNPEYYNFSSEENDYAQNFFAYGLQNSRGFRALKVWLGLKHLGRNGYKKLIKEDIKLAKLLYKLADDHPELEAVSQNLSITTFRYVPESFSDSDPEYLNRINEDLVNKLQSEGELFVSNAIIDKKYCLRACIVNFRTSEKDIRETIDIVVKRGRELQMTD